MRLTPAQIEKAIAVSPKEYPQEMPCAICGFRWMQHLGTLCPATPGGFMFAAGEAIPVMPVFQEESTFVPDVAYYNQSPDFDVV